MMVAIPKELVQFIEPMKARVGWISNDPKGAPVDAKTKFSDLYDVVVIEKGELSEDVSKALRAYLENGGIIWTFDRAVGSTWRNKVLLGGLVPGADKGWEYPEKIMVMVQGVEVFPADQRSPIAAGIRSVKVADDHTTMLSLNGKNADIKTGLTTFDRAITETSTALLKAQKVGEAVIGQQVFKPSQWVVVGAAVKVGEGQAVILPSLDYSDANTAQFLVNLVRWCMKSQGSGRSRASSVTLGKSDNAREDWWSRKITGRSDGSIQVDPETGKCIAIAVRDPTQARGEKRTYGVWAYWRSSLFDRIVYSVNTSSDSAGMLVPSDTWRAGHSTVPITVRLKKPPYDLKVDEMTLIHLTGPLSSAAVPLGPLTRPEAPAGSVFHTSCKVLSVTSDGLAVLEGFVGLVASSDSVECVAGLPRTFLDITPLAEKGIPFVFAGKTWMAAGSSPAVLLVQPDGIEAYNLTWKENVASTAHRAPDSGAKD